MKLNNFFKFMTPILAFLAISTAAEAKPLDDLCNYVNNQRAGLSVGVINLLKDNLSVRMIRPKACSQAELTFRSGRLWVYRLPQTRQYIMMLQGLNKQIADVSVTISDYPEIRMQQSEVVMADGVKIPTIVIQSADIPQDTPQIAVLTRSPYIYFEIIYLDLAIRAAAKGQTIVYQPNRGTFTAEGQFEWLDWKQEREDARSTLDWISSQKWSNKKVLAVGHSYDGFSAMAAATTFHPSLVGVFVSSAPWNPQEDSLSAGGAYGVAASYLYALNSGGGKTQYEKKKLLGAIGKSPSFSSYIKKFNNLSNLEFKSLPGDLKFSDNRDLVAELKKAKATMVYSFGVRADQDSRDIINLSHELAGTPNHFFFSHNQGHNSESINALYETLLMAGRDTTEKMNSMLTKITNGSPACAFTEPGSFRMECAADWNTLAGTQIRKSTFQNVAIDDESYVRTPARMLIYGTKTIKVKITTPRLSEPRWLDVLSRYCSSEACSLGAMLDVSRVRLKEGTHEYEFKSQHLFEDVPANGAVGISLHVKDAALNTVSEPAVQIHQMEVSLPVAVPK